MGIFEKNQNILFVDDEESIRDAYRTILGPSERSRTSHRLSKRKNFGSKQEYNLFFASSGEQGVAIFKEQYEKGEPISLGFFDMIMPGGIDGTETIRQIREIDSSVMCVIVTAYADRDPKEIREFFEDQSMWLYLNKPFNDGEIRQLASNMVNAWNLRRENLTYRHDLENLVQQRTEQLNKELEKVSIVQKNLLPQTIPQLPDVEVGVYYETCIQIGGGGDYYDFIEFPDEKLGIAVADASGHGPSAACIMAITRAMFRDIAREHKEPGKVLEQLNTKVDGNYPRGNFVTMLYSVLDLKTGEFVSANAAHPFPIYGKKETTTVMEGKTGMILGMFPGSYPETKITLKPGDSLILFTDGIEEQKNKNREEFGYERIIEAYKEHCNRSPQELITEIVAAADEFREDLSRGDDFTFVSLRWTPKK